MEDTTGKQTRLDGTPDALKGACPVRGALGGNLLPKGSKAPSFDSGPGREVVSEIRPEAFRPLDDHHT